MKVRRSLKKSILSAAAVFLFFPFVVSADSSYTVKKGDTLYSISRKYEITVAELRAANNLQESDVLKEGARLVIPSADIQTAAALSVDKSAVSETPAEKITVYTVEKGDTLYGIARKFQTSLPELLTLNNIDTSSSIKVGQKIKVPSSGSSSSFSSGSSSSSKGEKATGSGSGFGSGKDSSAVASKGTGSSSSAGTGNSAGNGSSSGNGAGSSTVSSSGSSTASSSKTDDTKVAEVKTAKEIPQNVSSGNLWPLSNPIVKKVSGKVSGVLLTGKSLESVRAVREGTVMYTGVYRGFGEVVFVQSKTGLIYSYTGLGSVACKKGDYVKAGDEIGKTGKGSDTSIKFMVFQNGMPVNPEKAPRG